MVVVLGAIAGIVVADATISEPPAPGLAVHREPPVLASTHATGRADAPVAAVRALVDSMPPGSISAAATDVDSGAHVELGSTTGLFTASVVKLQILETVLLQARDGGSALDPGGAASATAMMENSDNDAADALWQRTGGVAGAVVAGRRLGAPGLRPDAEGRWGLTVTGADDQLALLDALVAGRALDPGARAFALDLMRHVEPDQQWGVTAAADAGSSPAVKNGWLPVDDDGGAWVVSSVGVVTHRGRRLMIAVLTRYQVDEQQGIDRVESVARGVADAVLAEDGTAPNVPHAGA